MYMQDIIVEIKIIEDHYVNARYSPAYEALHHLCSNNQHCGEFSQFAMNIRSQYSDLENSIITMSMDLSQIDNRKRQICVAFDKLLSQMKKRFDSQHPYSAYEEQAICMKENRIMLRKSLLAVEDDISDCDNPKKIELLRQIKQQLIEVIEYFTNLMKSFRAVKNYE